MYAQKNGAGRGRERAPYAALRVLQNTTPSAAPSDAPVAAMPPACTAPAHNCLGGMPLAMVYAPDQQFGNLFAPDQWMDKGTVFADLYFPFCGARKGR